MRDPVSWGFYIGNFTFLVGVAAAAVVLVIPAYVYHWKPIKEIALIGELLAIAAIIMCMLFVTVDVGQPLRVWHMMPLLGQPELPDVAAGVGRGGAEPATSRSTSSSRPTSCSAPTTTGTTTSVRQAAHPRLDPRGRQRSTR